MTLRQLIDNGILNKTSQIEVGDDFFGTAFSVDEKPNAKDYLTVYSDDESFCFELDQAVEIDGLVVIASTEKGYSCELHFVQKTDLDPSLYTTTN